MPKVLLAEDDVTMVVLLKTLLSMEGFQVAAIQPDEPDILAAVRRENPDLLLLDVNLKGQNGLDVMQAVRLDAEYKDLRVVMSSGLNLEKECLESGANDFLLKPYMPDDLVKTLQRSLEA